MFSISTKGAASEVRLITLDPGHFHAALVQKEMYPQASALVHVYAPAGSDLAAHLQRIEAFNTRAEKPTHWEEKVFTGLDFLERMCQEKAGNVVVISGNNLRQTEYIAKAVAAGLNVLADKPMAITPEGFKQLCQTFQLAEHEHVLLYDIMTERYEITIALQRELARMPEVFGTFVPGTPEALFQTHIPQVGGARPQYDVARDGRFLIDTELQDTPADPIHLLLNWQPPAK